MSPIKKMLNNKQKFLLHHYARAAGINQPTYRQILRSRAGCASAADRQFSQSGFDRAMASLETILFQRVDEGHVPDPIGADRYIRSRAYWRNKSGHGNLINSRQLHQIEQRFNQLREWLPRTKSDRDYLLRIVARSIGRHKQLHQLTQPEAGFVLDALSDRLSYAIQKTTEVPF